MNQGKLCFYRSGILGEVLNFVEDYETGRWDKLNEFMRKTSLSRAKFHMFILRP